MVTDIWSSVTTIAEDDLLKLFLTNHRNNSFLVEPPIDNIYLHEKIGFRISANCTPQLKKNYRNATHTNSFISALTIDELCWGVARFQPSTRKWNQTSFWSLENVWVPAAARINTSTKCWKWNLGYVPDVQMCACANLWTAIEWWENDAESNCPDYKGWKVPARYLCEGRIFSYESSSGIHSSVDALT